MYSIDIPLSLHSSKFFPRNRIFKSRSNNAAAPLEVRCTVGEVVAGPIATGVGEPLLLDAVRGEKMERPPVWLMRQAGRYMKSYQLLCEKYPSFRERSENVDLVVEISLQPWKVFKPDGVILFSDILTPLPGMNIPFDIVKGKGPVIYSPLRTAADVDQVRNFNPLESVPYVGEALTILRAEVLHALLQKFATSMAEYIKYQADNGAQAVQIFDSWATELSPVDFEEFSLPYLKQIVDSVKITHPNLPLILYASGSGGLIERLPLTGVDVVSLDWTVDIEDGWDRMLRFKEMLTREFFLDRKILLPRGFMILSKKRATASTF